MAGALRLRALRRGLPTEDITPAYEIALGWMVIPASTREQASAAGPSRAVSVSIADRGSAVRRTGRGTAGGAWVRGPLEPHFYKARQALPPLSVPAYEQEV
jgi:hypothetical protein